jgi:hypothetical protein
VPGGSAGIGIPSATSWSGSPKVQQTRSWCWPVAAAGTPNRAKTKPSKHRTATGSGMPPSGTDEALIGSPYITSSMTTNAPLLTPGPRAWEPDVMRTRATMGWSNQAPPNE